ncbi:MAG: RNA polymerase sigma factor [Burkholderiales bacterium]|nr:RNA polymerase sigma factor [Burkholderiales bacterium]
MFWRQPTDTDTATLVERFARGDAHALDLLYRAEAAQVYRFALAMCGNPAWSADATQDAFVQLAEQPRSYDSAKGPLRAYLCGIARHKLLARWREAQGHWVAEDEGDEAPDEAAHATPEVELVRSQDTQALWAAIRALPWAFREALVLVDLQERPYAEAAQVAGVELNTLRTRLHRARQRLALALAAPTEEIRHE